MDRLRITGGRVLLRSDGEQMTDLVLEDGRIAGIGRNGRGAEVDARGLLVLPGIVDIHGDAFERQLQPRPASDSPPTSRCTTPSRSCWRMASPPRSTV